MAQQTYNQRNAGSDSPKQYNALIYDLRTGKYITRHVYTWGGIGIANAKAGDLVRRENIDNIERYKLVDVHLAQ